MDNSAPQSTLKPFYKLKKNLRFWFLVSCGVILIWIIHNQSRSEKQIIQPFIQNVFSLIKKNTALTGSSSKRVDIMDVFDRFKPRTLATCMNLCGFHDSVCKAKDWNSWDKALNSGKVTGFPLFSDNEYVFPWEKEYLSHPPLEDIKNLPDIRKTSVYRMINGVAIKENQVKAKVGESVYFRLDFVDGYGKIRKYGGDEIRVWMTEHPNTKPKHGYGATGLVTDLRNGSYLVTATPLWVGLTKLKIAFVYPREYIRAALHQARLGSHRFILGQFKKGDVKEATMCHPSPNIPGRPCVCNLTHVNQQSWFCGRPLDTRLSCKDWFAVWPSAIPPFKNFTPAEQIMAANKARVMEKALIPVDITLDVSSDGNGPTVPPCLKNDYTLTWTKESPRGMWSGDSWTYLVCKAPPATPQMAQKCLSNYTILVIGDSNSIRLHSGVAKLIPVKARHSGSWPLRSHHYNKRLNITLHFRPHEYPLYLHHRWVQSLPYGGVASELDKIPSHGKYVVIVHYYFHVSISHLSSFYLRLKALKESLSRLINRNPDVLIAVRGPHLSTVEWETNHMFSGEVFGPFMTRIWKEMFKDMRKRTVYLDGWDMTTPLQSQRVHPSDKVPQAMIRNLVSLWCS